MSVNNKMSSEQKTLTPVQIIVQQQTTPPPNDLKTRLLHIFLVFLGSIIVVLFFLLFRFNRSLFVAFICLYTIGYSMFILFYTNNKKDCFKNEVEFKALQYITLYTTFFAAFMFVLSIIVWRIEASQPKPVAF